MKKKNLNSEMEAIQDLLKGKQTTAPEAHSGEGIFFTSKVSSVLTIQSSHKKLIYSRPKKSLIRPKPKINRSMTKPRDSNSIPKTPIFFDT